MKLTQLSTLLSVISAETARKVALTNANFADNRCFKNDNGHGYIAENAINGIKYGQPYLKAQSAQPGVDFTADFALDENNWQQHDIGEIKFWPFEKCCWNEYETMKVFIESSSTSIECPPRPSRIYTTGVTLDNIMNSVRNERPVYFKCPAGTRGSKIRISVEDKYQRIQEVEVWTSGSVGIHSVLGIFNSHVWE